MTDSQWVKLNMFTGEIVPLEDEGKPKHRRSDAGFTAMVKLCGYENQPLTDSLRGALNKSYYQIRRAERERDSEITLEAIANLIIEFRAWFLRYRQDRFNEVCRRAPYPMETAKLWPEYRKQNSKDINAEWRAIYQEQIDMPGTLAYRLAHRNDEAKK